MKDNVRGKCRTGWLEGKSTLIDNLLNDFDGFTKKCITLAWRMVTQVPPLEIEYQSNKFNKKLHKKATGQKGEDIDYYVWPALLEPGGRVIQNAKVVCLAENKAES